MQVLYRNPRIPWKKRQDFCSTLVLSKLVHGFESWTFETQKSRDQLHAHMTDDAIIIASGLDFVPYDIQVLEALYLCLVDLRR